MIHISKTGNENGSNIKNKFGNQSWEKKDKRVLTIFTKYLRIYEINHSKNHPRKNYENESSKDTNFTVLDKIIAYLDNKSRI